MKIQCSDTNVFRSIQRHLTNCNNDFQTFNLPEKKNLRIVIKGVLSSIIKDKVKENLETQGYEVIRIREVGKSENRLPIHKVTLKNSPAIKEIFNLNFFSYRMVKIERYKANLPAQCFNCQKFGHSSRHCGYTLKCVMCSVSYKPSEYNKPKEDELQCSNCVGKQTANYKQYPAVLKKITVR